MDEPRSIPNLPPVMVRSRCLAPFGHICLHQKAIWLLQRKFYRRKDRLAECKNAAIGGRLMHFTPLNINGAWSIEPERRRTSAAGSRGSIARRPLPNGSWKHTFPSTAFPSRARREPCADCIIRTSRIARRNSSPACKASSGMCWWIFAPIHPLIGGGRGWNFQPKTVCNSIYRKAAPTVSRR